MAKNKNMTAKTILAAAFFACAACAPASLRQSYIVDEVRARAIAGETLAIANLAVMRETGTFVPRNINRAAHWFLLAAKAGDAEAQHRIGVLYREGAGVEMDKRAGARWQAQAAAQGHVEAQRDLGLLYKNGEGLERNMGEALFWLHAAAKVGEPQAQYELGIMYEEGLAGAPDGEKAYIWFALAARQFVDGALDARDRVARALSPVQFVRADHEARRRWREMKENMRVMSKNMGRSERISAP